MNNILKQKIKIKIKSILKYLLIIAGTVFLLVLLTALVIEYIYKDKIIKFSVDELNKQVNVPVNVRNIGFTFFTTFPNFSVELDNVVIKESKSGESASNLNLGKDTLLKAEKVYFLFNPIKLLTGDYEIKLLKVYNGFIRLKVYKSGINNFNIFKKQTNPQQSAGTNLNFDNILFSNIGFYYSDSQSDFQCAGLTGKLMVAADICHDSTLIKLDGGMKIINLTVGTVSYITDKTIEITSTVNILKDTYQFSLSKVNLQGVNFSTYGIYNSGTSPKINLEFESNKINVPDLIGLLPGKFTDNFNYYSKGIISVKGTIKGSFSREKTPDINLKFKVTNAALIQRKTNIKLSDINLQGGYIKNHFNDDILTLNSFSGKLGKGILRGNVVIRNIDEPIINITLYNKLNLNDIKTFLNIENIETLKGWAESNIIINGHLPSFKTVKLSDLSVLNYSGSINITDGSVKIKNTEYDISNVNGVINLQRDIELKNLVLKLHDNDFKINGTLINGISYIFGADNNAVLKADIYSVNLDLSNYFISNTDVRPAKAAYSRQLLFPENISLDVKLSINNFKLLKFNAKWISCNINYKPTIFTIKSVSFESMYGDISGNGLIVQDIDKNFITKCQLELSDIDINLMFNEFNNFTQNIITYNNLSGKLSGNINLSIQWNNNLLLDNDKLFVDGDINISNGQLIDFSYAKALSKFISMDELKTISFKTLKNRITVKDNKVNIPQMDIYSSAFNIKASGIHSFDNHYNYKVKILLSDILWGKAKRHKKENEEFGIVEDDGLGKTTIPLSIKGFNTDFKISYDSKEAFDMFKTTLVNQRTEMKEALNNEFGWYKNDTTVKREKLAKKQQIRVSWDDDTTAVDNIPKPAVKKKKTKKDDDVKVEWNDDK